MSWMVSRIVSFSFLRNIVSKSWIVTLWKGRERERERERERDHSTTHYFKPKGFYSTSTSDTIAKNRTRLGHHEVTSRTCIIWDTIMSVSWLRQSDCCKHEISTPTSECVIWFSMRGEREKEREKERKKETKRHSNRGTRDWTLKWLKQRPQKPDLDSPGDQSH